MDFNDHYRVYGNLCTMKGLYFLRNYFRTTKDSFLRELREVAPEMELFLENHSLYEKFL